MARRLYFPAGGLNRRFGFQHQPPFTTAACLNARPFDVEEGRERGGSRPGLGRVFPQKMFASHDFAVYDGVEELYSVNVVPVLGSVQRFWSDTFSSSQLASVWTVDGVAPDVFGGSLYFAVHDGAVLLRDAVEDLDALSPQVVRVVFSRVGDVGFWGGACSLYVGAIDPEGAKANSVALRVEVDGPSLRVNVGQWVNGEFLIATTATLPDAVALTDAFRVQLSYHDGRATCEVSYLDGTVIPNSALTDVPVAPPRFGPHVGFGVEPAGHASVVTRASEFEYEYRVVAPAHFDQPRQIIVGIDRAGSIWSTRDEDRQMRRASTWWSTHPAGDPTKARVPKSAASHLGLLYIADPALGPWVYNPGGHIPDLPAVRLDPSGVEVPLSDNGGQLFPWQVGVYPDSDELPKGDLDKYPPYGVPAGNHLLVRYAGRMVLGGEPAHALWMSRAGDPHDWDFGASEDDLGRATWSLSGDWGALPGATTALVPFSDDYLIIGERDAIWRMMGDPLAGGGMVNVTQAVGIIGKEAWCVTPESVLVFVGHEGLFMLAPGGGSFPVAVSPELIPRELVGLDPSEHRVQLVYDRQKVGVHVFITSLSGGANLHWWLDWRTKGFWPVSLDGEHLPQAVTWFDGDGPIPAGVLLGARDGYVRRFVDGNALDDGKPFESYCDYGPVRLTNADSRRGVFRSVRGFSSSTSGPVTLSVRVGGTPEEAFRATPVASRVVDGKLCHVKRGGSAAYIRASGNGSPWHIENIEVEAETVGPAKPL